MCKLSAPIFPFHRQHVLLRIDDALDQRSQLLERELHLVVVLVPIVDAAHAAGDVPETPLGHIDRDASARQQRARGAPQIVNGPARDAAGLVERPLGGTFFA